jgi:26S proteasome regulatory subunit N13
VDLSSSLTAEAMIPVLANAEVQQRLIPLLPEAADLPKTEEELRATVHSPQFQQVCNNNFTDSKGK